MGFYIGREKASRPREGFIPNPKLKLLEQVSEVMRFKHYSIRTETTYREWIRRFILFHGKRHPREMGAREVERFLSDLAMRRKVAASTQNQAFRSVSGVDQTVHPLSREAASAGDGGEGGRAVPERPGDAAEGGGVHAESGVQICIGSGSDGSSSFTGSGIRGRWGRGRSSGS